MTDTQPIILDVPSDVLLLSAPAAAKALSISTRKLSELTANGTIPCVRWGWRVLYDPNDLRAAIAAGKTTGNAKPRRDRSKEQGE